MPVSTANDHHDDERERKRDNAENLRESREELQNEIETIRRRYEGLIEAGFNEMQAMTCLMHGWESQG